MDINIFKNIMKAFKFFYKNYQKRTIAIFLITIIG